MSKTAKAEQVDRPFKPCQCFADFAYEVPSDPEDDSSAPVALAFNPCGGETQNDFCQGHDAKLKSALQRCFRAGIGYAILDGGLMIDRDPLQVAAERGWSKFMTPGKAKATPKVKKVKAPKGDQLSRLNGMKAAAKLVKTNKLLGEDGKALQVTPENFQFIIDGQLDQAATEVTLSGPKVGDDIKVNYRRGMRAATVTEIEGERARVVFDLNGKTISRVYDLASL